MADNREFGGSTLGWSSSLPPSAHQLVDRAVSADATCHAFAVSYRQGFPRRSARFRSLLPWLRLQAILVVGYQPFGVAPRHPTRRLAGRLISGGVCVPRVRVPG